MTLWTGSHFVWDGTIKSLLERLAEELHEHQTEYEYRTHPSVLFALDEALVKERGKLGHPGAATAPAPAPDTTKR